MATLSNELVTQRSNVTGVGYSSTDADNANGVVAWQATTTLPNTTVLNTDVAANLDTKAEVDAAVTGEAYPD